MRGGALRMYQPGQGGRGLGGVIKKAASYLGQRFVLPYLKRKATKKVRKTLSSLKRKLPRNAVSTIAKMRKMMTTGQGGGALKGRRRPRRRQKRKAYRDIFKY